MGQPSHIGAGACHSRRAGETTKEEGNGEGWNGVCGREQKMPKRADSKGQTGSGEGGSRDSNGAGMQGKEECEDDLHVALGKWGQNGDTTHPAGEHR